MAAHHSWCCRPALGTDSVSTDQTLHVVVVNQMCGLTVQDFVQWLSHVQPCKRLAMCGCACTCSTVRVSNRREQWTCTCTHSMDTDPTKFHQPWPFLFEYVGINQFPTVELPRLSKKVAQRRSWLGNSRNWRVFRMLCCERYAEVDFCCF